MTHHAWLPVAVTVSRCRDEASRSQERSELTMAQANLEDPQIRQFVEEARARRGLERILCRWLGRRVRVTAGYGSVDALRVQ